MRQAYLHLTPLAAFTCDENPEGATNYRPVPVPDADMATAANWPEYRVYCWDCEMGEPREFQIKAPDATIAAQFAFAVTSWSHEGTWLHTWGPALLRSPNGAFWSGGTLEDMATIGGDE